jgi:cytochrome c oxidase cbb3-type subunit I/II
MWKEFTPDGFLAYPNFLKTVTQILPMYYSRAFGGTLYLLGTFVMIYNLIKTAGAGEFMAYEYDEAHALSKNKVVGGAWHAVLERKPILFTVLALIAVLIGGVVEFVPTWLVESNVPTISSVKPYTPLELEGRDIYVKEGCYNCHSQMIRPFRSETERYGEYSKSGEFVYDHPFQWGSRRTGPDLHRIGGKYPDSWHYNHMLDPTTMSPGSIMPAYPWLFDNDYDKSAIASKIKAMQTLGVPYEEGYSEIAQADMEAQAEKISKGLAEGNIKVDKNKEIVALIAYLQRMGTDIKGETTALNK